MGNLKEILRNTVSGWLASVLRVIVALLLVPFLIRQLGTEGYGLVGLLGVIMSLAQVADFGLRNALGRELSEKAVSHDRHGFGELMTSALALYFCIALVLSTAVFFFAPGLVRFFKVPEVMHGHAISLVRTYGVGSIVLSFVTPVFSSALGSYNRFDVVNFMKIWSSLASSILLFLVLSVVSNALWGWVAVMLSSQVLILILTAGMFLRVCGSNYDLSCFRVNLTRLPSLFRLGGLMYALQMSQALAERSDPLVISYFFGPAGVALYRPGSRLAEIIRPVVLTLTNQLYPLTTKHHLSKDNVRLGQLLVKGTKFTVLLGGACCAAMYSFAMPFCRLWLLDSMGQDYLIAAKVMQAWALALFFIFVQGTQWPVFLGMKRLKVLTVVQLPTAVLNILLSIYFVGFTSMGIPGVLIATVIIEMIRRPFLFIYCARLVELPAAKMFGVTYARATLVTVLSCLITSGMIFLKPPQGWASLLLQMTIYIVSWLFMMLTLGLTKQERRLLVGMVSIQFSRGAKHVN